MSPGGVASDSSVTLTLADAQGMLDGVTLNLNTQVRKKHISKHTFHSHASEAICWCHDWFKTQLGFKCIPHSSDSTTCHEACVMNQTWHHVVCQPPEQSIFYCSGSDISCSAEWLWSVRTVRELRPAGHTGQPSLPVHQRRVWQWIQCECVRHCLCSMISRSRPVKQKLKLVLHWWIEHMLNPLWWITRLNLIYVYQLIFTVTWLPGRY